LDSTTGSLYIADQNNHAIRVVEPNGTITTFAGGNGAGFTVNCDGMAAVSVQLNMPADVYFDVDSGLLYIADTGNHVVWKVDNHGLIYRIAGQLGQSGTSGEGGLATLARLNGPTGVTTDSGGLVYIADTGNAGKVELPLVRVWLILFFLYALQQFAKLTLHQI
jgi:sugar lactone lactonase YvrE